MAKFNLQDLLNERSKEVKKEEMEQIFLDLDEIIPSESNFYNTKNIDRLKQNIALVGVLQPLLVKKQEDGTYLLLAGHRRRLACLALVAEGMEEFKKVPCVLKDTNVVEEKMQTGEVNAILEQLALIFANDFRDKSEWEKMEETLQVEGLISELKKKSGLKGRVRSILSEYTGIKETQIARYKAISNNLIPELKGLFKENELNISIAYELSILRGDYQHKAYASYVCGEKLTLSDVRELKRQEEENKPIKGQMTFEEIERTWEKKDSYKGDEIADDTNKKSGCCINKKNSVVDVPGQKERKELKVYSASSSEQAQTEDSGLNKIEVQKDDRLLNEIEMVIKKYTKYCDDYKKAGLKEKVIREKEIIKNALELYYKKVSEEWE